MVTRGHLTLIRDERDVRLYLYGQADRIVRAEPKPSPPPTPPRPAA